MKKVLPIFLASLVFLFLFSGITKAQAPVTVTCDESSPTGFFAPGLSGTNGIVPCGRTSACRCELIHIFILILNIYNFILWNIATPLAALLIVLGGVLMIISGGPGKVNPITSIASPNLYNTAKNMVWWSVIGITLIFSSWLIIDIVLKVIGYTGLWSSPF